MKKLLLTITLCTSAILVSNYSEAQTQNKKSDDQQWPPSVVLKAAEVAVERSTQYPPGTYDYYYFNFSYSNGVWNTLVEYYSYSTEPGPSPIRVEYFYFKNNGTQVFDVKKPNLE
jgi:hypothetical protein